jgi:hypothetical protein
LSDGSPKIILPKVLLHTKEEGMPHWEA